MELPKLIIYFEANGTVNNSTWLKSLNFFLGKPLKDNHIHLLDLLRYIKDPNGMERELDNLDICSIRENSFSLLFMFMPELGKVVPSVLHYLLDYSCTYIDPGECVACEKIDHIIDEKSESEFVLAKVIKANGGKNDYPMEDFWTISYSVDIGNEQPIQVEASKLYNFIKNKKDAENKEVVNNAVVFNWNLDRVKTYIKNVLKSAFERGSQEFERILKRLLLQYRPDKHQEIKDNFIELTLFIDFIKQKLENCQSLDDEAISTFNPNEILPNKKLPVHQPGAIHERYQIKYVSMEEQIGSDFNDFIDQLKLKGSQPEQAKLWFRQAEYDFRASTSDKNQSETYNWACYKCHQVCCELLCIFNFYFLCCF